MDFRQLSYFLAILDYPSMSKAAEALHISQPALSSTIKSLEKELGFSLFEHSGNHLAVNENGLYFASRARKALETIHDAQTTISKGIALREQTLSCNITIPFGKMGKEIFKHFHLEHPEARITIHQAGLDYPLSSNAPSVDLEIFGSTERLDENERLIKICSERFVAALPATHKLADYPSIKLWDLRNDFFILGKAFKNNKMRNVIDEMFEQAGFKPKIVGVLPIANDILQMVKAGICCTIAAEITWFDEESREFVVKPIEDIQRSRTIYARIPDEATPSQATWEFFEFLKSVKPRFFDTK